MKDSLVAASAEFQGEIFFGFDELAVYEGIDTGEHLVSVFGVDFSAGDEVYIIEISGVAPDIFLRVAFFGNLSRTFFKNGRSARWFSGSKGSPPRRENPWIYAGLSASRISASTSLVYGLP